MLISKNGLGVATDQLLSLHEADSRGALESYTRGLDDEVARDLWNCLRRVGWQAPAETDCCHAKILWWLQSEDIKRGHREATAIATVFERLEDAATRVATLQSYTGWLPTSCCEAFSMFRTWKVGGSMNSSPFGLPHERTWQLNSESFSSRDELFRLFFDDELIAQIVTTAARHLLHEKLAYKPTVAGRLEGREADPIVLVKWAKDQLQYALDDICRAWQRSAIDSAELVNGWEIPNRGEISPIRNKAELCTWLSGWLEAIHDARNPKGPYSSGPDFFLEDIQRELRNARRALRKWGIGSPIDFGDVPTMIDHAERQIEQLIDELSSVAMASEDSGNGEVAGCETLLVELGTEWKPWPLDQASANHLVCCGMAEYFGQQVLGDLKVAVVWSGPVRRTQAKGSFSDEAITQLIKKHVIPESWRDDMTGSISVALVPEFMRLTPKGIKWKQLCLSNAQKDRFITELRGRSELKIEAMVDEVLQSVRSKINRAQTGNASNVSDSSPVNRSSTQLPPQTDKELATNPSLPPRRKRPTTFVNAELPELGTVQLEYGSHLYNLWSWADRIERNTAEKVDSVEFAFDYFQPDELAEDAIQHLGKKHQIAINVVLRQRDVVVREYAKIDDRTEGEFHSFFKEVSWLRDRIVRAVAVIFEAENAALPQKAGDLSPTPAARKEGDAEHQPDKEAPPQDRDKEWLSPQSVASLVDETGCSRTMINDAARKGLIPGGAKRENNKARGHLILTKAGLDYLKRKGGKTK